MLLSDIVALEFALKLCDENQNKIDLVLTDLVMPGMGGHELASHLACRHPGIKCCSCQATRKIAPSGEIFSLKGVHSCRSRSASATSPMQCNRL
jgi:DNA-binding NarL/FixJ family response regulator